MPAKAGMTSQFIENSQLRSRGESQRRRLRPPTPPYACWRESSFAAAPFSQRLQ